MIELTALALAILIIFGIVIPRTTFLVTWFFNTAAVGAVLGGSALVLAIFGFLFFPKVLLTYLLLEAMAGAPASGSTLYWLYIGLAALLDLTSKLAASGNRNTE